MSLSQAQIAIVKSTVPILKEHGKTITTTFYRNMLAAHPELKNYFSLRNQQTGAQQQALANSVLAYAQYIDDLPKITHAVERIAQKHVSLFIKAEHYPIVGQYLIGAIGEVLGPALTTDIKDAWVLAYGQLADVFIQREKTLYQEAGEWQSWRQFKIISKEQENEGVVNFTLEPTDGKALPKFLPGQYVSLQIPVPEIEGLVQSRQFSLSESPENSTTHYRVSVKREQTIENAPIEELAAGKVPGLVSNMLHNSYNVGNFVELSPPHGEFYVDPSNTAALNKPLVLLSAGVGAAPLLSIHDAVLASKTASRPITWIHGARHSGTSCYAKHVRETAAQRDNVTARIFLEDVRDGDQQGDAYDFTGQVNLEKLAEEKLLHLENSNTEYYVCGPEEWMVDTFTSHLILLSPVTPIHWTGSDVPEPQHWSHRVGADGIGSRPEGSRSGGGYPQDADEQVRRGPAGDEASFYVSLFISFSHCLFPLLSRPVFAREADDPRNPLNDEVRRPGNVAIPPIVIVVSHQLGHNSPDRELEARTAGRTYASSRLAIFLEAPSLPPEALAVHPSLRLRRANEQPSSQGVALLVSRGRAHRGNDGCLCPFGVVFLNLPPCHVFPTSPSPEPMAMTMAESVIRKACDRCHAQKLSCKRSNDEPCERCVRLKAECKSSPSLRYKKQQQQQGQLLSSQSQQSQNQQTRPTPITTFITNNINNTNNITIIATATTIPNNNTTTTTSQPPNSPPPLQTQPSAALPSDGGRTVIRVSSHPTRPIDSMVHCLERVDHRLTVLPKAVPIVAHTPHTSGSLTAQGHLVVTPDPVPVLDIADFDFTFDQLGFFATSSSHPEQHLSHPGLPGSIVVVDHHHQQHQHPLHLQSHHHHHPPHPNIHDNSAVVSSAAVAAAAVFADSWDPRLTTPSSAAPAAPESYPVVPPDSLALPLAVPLADGQHLVPQAPQRKRRCAPKHNSSSDKPSRPRTKQRPRQITLRPTTAGDTPPLQLPPPLQRHTPVVHWMAQLSDINARLLDLSSALSSSPEEARNGPSLGHSADEGFVSQGFPIDEMFKLTRCVADILEQPPSEASLADRDTTKARHSAVDSSDPGNAMFILSTYVRLLDIYQKVFSLVNAELSQTDSGATFHFWKLPDVTVGSFAVESSPFLQMSLTIQLAEEFLSRLRNSTARWSGASVGNGTSMFSGVIDISFQAVKDQEEALAKYLVELRSDIEALLD
ncbi:hypothetical protein G7046_g8313 [Stylonectria norvegica]|nr:hypothetical protein G7046_g8313 [Stylonectria norvegica]